MDTQILLNGDPANNAYAARLCEEGRIDELIEFCANENSMREIDVVFPNSLYTVIKCKNCIELRLRTSDRMVDKLIATFPKQSTK